MFLVTKCTFYDVPNSLKQMVSNCNAKMYQRLPLMFELLFCSAELYQLIPSENLAETLLASIQQFVYAVINPHHTLLRHLGQLSPFTGTRYID